MTPPKKTDVSLSKGQKTLPNYVFGIEFSTTGKEKTIRRITSSGDSIELRGFGRSNDDLANRIISHVEKMPINNNIHDAKLCRGHLEGNTLIIEFYSSDEEILYTERIDYDNLGQFSSWRTRHNETMGDKKEKNTEKPLRPRWAEETRPKKQVKLRLKPGMISEVDAAADSSGKNRNDWIEEAIQKALDAVKPKPK